MIHVSCIMKLCMDKMITWNQTKKDASAEKCFFFLFFILVLIMLLKQNSIRINVKTN